MLRLVLLVSLSVVGVTGWALPECVLEETKIAEGTCCIGMKIILNGAISRMTIEGDCVDVSCYNGQIITSGKCKCSQKCCGCFNQGKFYRRGQVLRILKNEDICTEVFCNSDGETSTRGLNCEDVNKKRTRCLHAHNWYNIGDHVYTDRVGDLCADAYCAPNNKLYYSSYFECEGKALKCVVEDIAYYAGWVIEQTKCSVSVCDQTGVFRKLHIPNC